MRVGIVLLSFLVCMKLAIPTTEVCLFVCLKARSTWLDFKHDGLKLLAPLAGGFRRII
jgi:hypothetical protein